MCRKKLPTCHKCARGLKRCIYIDFPGHQQSSVIGMTFYGLFYWCGQAGSYLKPGSQNKKAFTLGTLKQRYYILLKYIICYMKNNSKNYLSYYIAIKALPISGIFSPYVSHFKICFSKHFSRIAKMVVHLKLCKFRFAFTLT